MMARKDAKAQRKKGLSPEDAKPGGRQGAKKKTLCVSAPLRAKKKYLEEEKFKLSFAARRPIRHGGQAVSE